MGGDWLNSSMYQGSCKPELDGDRHDLYVFAANSSAPGGQEWTVIGSIEACTKPATAQN